MTQDNDIIAYKIIMIEDDEGHATLIERNLRRSGVDKEIIRLQDGAGAMQYFSNEMNDEERPAMILLDVNLPDIDGYEILRYLKEQDHTRDIPVIVMTTTEDQREIDRCYQYGCNLYVSKPVEYDKFSESVQSLGQMIKFIKVPGPRKAATS